MEKAIKWLKGTCNYDLFKSYMEDIKIAIEIAVQEGKQEVFDDIEKEFSKPAYLNDKNPYEILEELKKKHLNPNKK